MTATVLKTRAIIRLTPTDAAEDVRGFLQGLVTNDVAGELPVYAALLSAQGKMMFDFFVWDGSDGGLLIDCEGECADDLVRRLSLYRLRRKIDIAREGALSVHWSPAAADDDQNVQKDKGAALDPRMPELGLRWIAPAERAETDAGGADDAYFAHRMALRVPEGRAEMGDILWLETNAVELNGVSFEKGCYIGQENTARMNWRQKVNRRLVVVPLPDSSEKRRKAAYRDAGLAVDHLRVGDLDPDTLPPWQRAAITD